LSIAFDVDNVLADTLTVWVSKVNKKHRLGLTLEDIRSHKNPGLGYLEPWQTYSMLDRVWDEWETIPLSDINTLKVLDQLSKIDLSIDIATSRPERSLPNVKKWLELHNIPYDTFYGLGPRKSKKDIKSDYLVDDAPEHIRDFAKTGRTAIVYTKPWNLRINGNNIVRVSNFDEIQDVVEKERKKPRQQFFS